MAIRKNIKRRFWGKTSAKVTADDLHLATTTTDIPPSSNLHRRSSAPSFINLASVANVSPSAKMKYPLEVQYAHPGAQPPVFVAGSWTNPPWDPQEMLVRDDKTEDGHLMFYKKFEDVEEGEYQYKFRLGPGDWWVTDETADTVIDSSGNKNNHLRVKAPAGEVDSKQDDSSAAFSSQAKVDVKEVAEEPEGPSSHSHVVESHEPAAVELSASTSKTEDTPNSSELSTEANTTEKPLLEKVAEPKSHIPVDFAPIPFTVVETVPDQEQPVYGDLEATRLETHTSKQVSDAEPDVEYERPSTAGATEEEPTQTLTSPEIPQLVVEKTDSTLRHGDDFGATATSSQKLAHEMRKADAQPDEVVISPPLKPLEPHDVAQVEQSLVQNDNVQDAEENMQLLPHERTNEMEEEDSVELDVPLLSHERSVEEEDDDLGLSRVSSMEPVKVEGGIPLFAHECSSLDDIHSFTSNMPRNKSTASLRSIRSLKSIDEDEDVNDPSLERFPTAREEIYEHIRRTESRLPEDDSIEQGQAHAINGERSPGHVSTSSVGNISPLNPITEDDQDADFTQDGYDDYVKLPAPATSLFDREANAEVPSSLPVTTEEQNEEAEQSQDAPPTPPLTPKKERQVRVDEGSETRPSQSQPAQRSSESDVEVSAEEDTETTFRNDSVMHDGLRQRKASPPPKSSVSPSGSTAPSSKGKEGLIQTLWRMLFGSWLGPLTQWLIGLAVGKRNTA